MKKSMKKVCAGILCATMALALTTPVTKGLMKPETSVEAEVQYDGEVVYKNRTFRFVYYGTGVRILSVDKAGGDLEIPSEITRNGITSKVISIGDSFGKGRTFNTVKIPNTVTRIEHDVFKWAIIESKIVLSDNLERIGRSFCDEAVVPKIECKSKKIREIGSMALGNAECPNPMTISNWLVKYEFPKNVDYIDLTSKEFDGVENAYFAAFDYYQNKKTIKLSSKNANRIGFLKGLNLYEVENIEIDGEKVVPKDADDILPDSLCKNYKVISDTPFAISYFDKKARLVLNKLGLTYYGMNNNMVGKLSANKEYEICLKIHDYLVKNYTYDINDCLWDFFGVFSTNGKTVCQMDAGMFASLAEAAGVDAEVCYNGSNGIHGWNVVTVGGDKYFIDVTWDRCLNNYRWFLCSNNTMNSDESDCHHNIKYTNYSLSTWQKKKDFFANRALGGKYVDDCKITHGDLNMDYEGGVFEDDLELLKAYLRLDDNTRNKCLEANNGIVSMSNSELAKLNSLTIDRNVNAKNGFPLTDDGKHIRLGTSIGGGKVKLTFDPTVVDINFDGSVTTADMVALMKLHTHPLGN